MIGLNNSWLPPSLGALGLWGIWTFIPKIAMQTMSVPSVIFYEAIGNVLAIVPVLFFMKGKLETNRQGISFVARATVASMIALLSYYYAVRLGPIATVITITAMYPAVVLVLARIFLKEKFNRTQLAAGGMALVSVVLLAG